MAFKMMDSKVGERATFADYSSACAALVDWIHKQRQAGEPVVEQPSGQWSDSRLTIWICDANDEVVKIQLDTPTASVTTSS